MITYEKLWVTMKQKKVSQYRLKKHYGFSSGQLWRLRKNKNVSTNTLNVLCRILNCPIQEIVEFQFDANEEPISMILSGSQKGH